MGGRSDRRPKNFAKNMNFKNTTELKFNNDDLYALEHGNRHIYIYLTYAFGRPIVLFYLY